MRTFKVTLEYDGTDYHGWQTQPNVATIQGEVEKALRQIIGATTHVIGAGRTDAGVHAQGQVASFSSDTELSLSILCRALNSTLPADIVVTAVEEAPTGFDACRDAVNKTYRYTILNRPSPSALDRRYCLWVPSPLHREAMGEALSHILGEHDFTSFRAAGCTARTSSRTVSGALLTAEADSLRVEVTADGFLKNMMRILVGTLLEVGKGRMTPVHVKEILAARDRSRAGKTLPPQGLCLMEVRYPL